jgi:hypothetical protein
VHTGEDRLFLYIAAHGGSRTVGSLESESGKSSTSGMHHHSPYKWNHGYSISKDDPRVRTLINREPAHPVKARHRLDFRLHLRDRLDFKHSRRCNTPRTPDGDEERGSQEQEKDR